MISEFRDFANRKLADARIVKQLLRREIIALTEAEVELNDALEAQSILQATAAVVQQSAHERIAAVVTRCLQTVFDDPYQFRIIFEQKRGKTEAKLLFERNGYSINPKMAAGGGVIDIAAFALRLAALLLSRPQPRKFLFLDEPFRMLSRTLGPRVKELIETLSKELGVQFVIITHDESLVAGKVIDLS